MCVLLLFPQTTLTDIGSDTLMPETLSIKISSSHRKLFITMAVYRLKNPESTLNICRFLRVSFRNINCCSCSSRYIKLWIIGDFQIGHSVDIWIFMATVYLTTLYSFVPGHIYKVDIPERHAIQSKWRTQLCLTGPHLVRRSSAGSLCHISEVLWVLYLYMISLDNITK